MSVKRLYRVTAIYVTRDGKATWLWTRCYQSKQAAERMAERRRTGWEYEPGPGWDDEGYVQEPAQSVRIDVSNPVTWP